MLVNLFYLALLGQLFLGGVTGQCDLPLEDFCDEDKVEMILWCSEHCVSEWSPWSACNSLCGKGEKVRSRTSANADVCGMFPDFTCTLDLYESAPCNKGCPYGGVASDDQCIDCPYDRTGSCCESELWCEYPGEPVNGRVSGVWPARPGSVAQFSCHAGFTLQGSQSAVCLTDGTWTSAPPSCQNMCVGGTLQNHNGQFACTCLPGCSGTYCEIGCAREQGNYGDYILVMGATLTRVESADACATLGLHLVNVQTVDKFNEIVQFTEKFSYNPDIWDIWTGGQVSTPGEWGPDLDDWMWSDRTILSYDRWCAGEPNNKTGADYYIGFFLEDGIAHNCLNDELPSFVCNYICESYNNVSY